jgi:formate hydrogenlyase subunit 4
MTWRIVDILLLLLLPFLFTGLINRTKAFWAGRRGAPLLQPLFDTIRLLGKSPVFGRETSLIFQFSAPLGLAAVLTAGLFVPVAGTSLLPFEGDFVVFILFLGLARFFLLLSALDTGSSFEGMGASREAVFSLLAEPALLLLLAAFAYMQGAVSFTALLAPHAWSGVTDLLVRVLAALAFLILLLTEGGRVPVDDPATHLELTMVHEVMVLDHSGPDLALQNYAHALKTTFFAVVICGVFQPAGLSPLSSRGLLLAGLALIAVLAGCVESFMARLRLSHVPQFILFAFALSCLLSFVLLTGR